MSHSANLITPERVETLSRIERNMGYTFANLETLDHALTHPSFAHEQPRDEITHYEQLEFVGDAVLDLVVGHILYMESPGESEGYLTRARADLVNKNRLASMARQLELGPALRLGKGETASRGWQKPSIQADIFEAVIGATYLDGGYEKAFEVIARLFKPLLKEQKTDLKDPRSLLQEWAQKRYHQVPTYAVLSAKGPGHNPVFKVEVQIGKSRLAVAEGPTKKEACRRAAKEAFENIESGRREIVIS